MFKTKRSLHLSLVLILTTVIISCKKEYGCTYQVGENFDVDAKRHDGSCVYKASASIKWTNSHAYFTEANLSTISVYIDNTVIAKDVNVFLYDENTPLECNSAYWFNFEKLFLLKNAPGASGGVFWTHLDVFNHNDSLIYSIETGLVAADSCNLIEFTMP